MKQDQKNIPEHLQSKWNEISDTKRLINFYIQEVAKLERKEVEFFICDLDDTLISKEQLLEETKILKGHTPQENSERIIDVYGLNEFMLKNYSRDDIPN